MYLPQAPLRGERRIVRLHLKAHLLIRLSLAAGILLGTCASIEPPALTSVVSSTPVNRNSPSAVLPWLGSTRFRRINTSDGISHPYITGITRDQQGFVWIATSNGLNLYDGYTFTAYQNKPGDRTTLDFNDLSVVYIDSENTLWVGGAGGIDRFNREEGIFERIDEYGQVFALRECSDGRLWAGFWHGLYAYDRHTGAMLESFVSKVDEKIDPENTLQGYVRAIAEDSQGILWIGTDYGLYRFDRASMSFARHPINFNQSEEPLSQRVRSVFVDAQDEIWVGTSYGLGHFEQASGNIKLYPFEAGGTEFGNETVTTIQADKSGNMWIGTLHGLVLFNPALDRYERFLHDPKVNTSLSDNFILSVFVGPTGLTWVGTTNGISLYNPRANQFQTYLYPYELVNAPPLILDEPSPTSFSEMKVEAILEDHQGNLWIGTKLGGLIQMDSNSGEVNIFLHDPDDPNSLSDNRVSAVYQDHKGNLWVGTGSGWLEKYDPEKDEFVHLANLSAPIVALNEDGAKNLWIGTHGNGVAYWRIEAGGLTHFPWEDPAQPSGFSETASHIITSIMIDDDGVPWIGSYLGGINLWKNNLFTHYRHQADDIFSLGDDYVNVLWQDSRDKNIIWVGTMGGGLDRFDLETGHFTHFTTANGLPDNIVTCILEDGTGNLWLNTSRGLSRFTPETGEIWNYNGADGIPEGSVLPGGCLKRTDGTLLFTTPNNIITFDPTLVSVNETIPSIAITTLMVNTLIVMEDVTTDSSIQRTYRENYFTFEFAALDYAAPEENTFAYKMEGLDLDWVAAGTRNRADYPDLDPGEYTFRVLGANSDGVWNEQGLAVHISITPPFWQTGWFLGLIGLVLVAAVYTAYRGRLRGLELQRQALEKEVRARTDEINQRRREIEALYRADEDLYRHLDLEQVLQALVDTAVPLVKADQGAVLGWDAARENLVVLAALGLQDDMINQVCLAHDSEEARQILTNDKPRVVEDASQELPGMQGTVRWEGIRAFIQMPIRIGDEVFGEFNIAFIEPRKFTVDEIRLLAALTQRAAVAIQNAQLFEKAQELAASEERSRLAHDLHDAVTQTLFSASLIAEALPLLWERSPQKGRDRLEKLRLLNRGALAEMRTLLLELRPKALLDANFEHLVQQLGAAASGQTGVPVNIKIEGSCKLPEKVHLSLYRIIQEALNNTIKHANARQIDIILTCKIDSEDDNQALHLIIWDDGKGFDTTNVSPDKLGLRIMRERAQSIGAVLDVASYPGKGTRIQMIWRAGLEGRDEETNDE